nr:hypothetical protein [Arsenicicoccus piscis]
MLAAHPAQGHRAELDDRAVAPRLGVQVGDHRARLLLDEQHRVGVRPHEVGHVLGIEVVRVLVGDDDGIEVGEAVPVVGEPTGVDQDPPVRDLDEDAGVSEVGDRQRAGR